ncbi:MAG: GNAT family N-acetyltransferase [Oscillospiraceae bacterium]|nr:GNAT family N-acetyltransferase [Oscillospiraceae bacterium]
MKQELKFTAITQNDKNEFYRLMQMYASELDEHQHRNTDPEILKKWTFRIVEKQSDTTRPIYLKFCCIDSAVIGFFYADVDKAGDKGFVKNGYGCILEFYVLPEYRRCGYGKEMFLYLQDMFKSDGIKKMYLTADPVTGKPFWEALGFKCTGEICPDNNQMVYEMAVSDDT